MEYYQEVEFTRDFLRSLISSRYARSGSFYHRGWPYCWGSFREYGSPPDGCLVIEADINGDIEEFRVWYGEEVKGKISRARHVRYDDAFREAVN